MQQWLDARDHLSKATQVYASATTFLESVLTPFSIKLIPGVLATIQINLETMERDELALQRAQVPLKKKRNTYVSPIYTLPSELLAYIFKAAVASTSDYSSTAEYDKKALSHVCFRWREIALDVCPVWDLLCLTFNDHSNSDDGQLEVDIELHGPITSVGYVRVSVYHQPGQDDAQYIRTVLATIAPYIKWLDRIAITIDKVEKVQPFVDFWLENGTPGSLTDLSLSANCASLVFPEANSHSNNLLCLFLQQTKELEVNSVGLDWSSVAFNKLTSMWLSNMPSPCCITSAQLAKMLLTCPDLETLGLNNVMIPIPLDLMAFEPVRLEHLNVLYLKGVDISRVLSMIYPGRDKLDLQLDGIVSDTDTLESLHSFASRANMHNLTLTLSESRLDDALALLLYSVMSSIPHLRNLILSNMSLRSLELNTLAEHPIIQYSSTLPLALAGDTNETSHIRELELLHCNIHATALAFHDAVSTLSWSTISLVGCNHVTTSQGEAADTTEVLERIAESSGFGAQLSELRPDRVNLPRQ